MKNILFLFGFQLVSIGFLFTQETDKTIKYNPQDFYLPSFNPPAGTLFRSAKGTPGPMLINWFNLPCRVLEPSS